MHLCVLQETQDLELVEAIIDQMDEEFMFWIQNRMANIATNDGEYSLAHYTSDVNSPRPGKTSNMHDFRIYIQVVLSLNKNNIKYVFFIYIML